MTIARPRPYPAVVVEPDGAFDTTAHPPIMDDSDRQPFAEMSENAAVMEHLRPRNTRSCDAWIDFQINHQSSHGFFLWALESRASG